MASTASKYSDAKSSKNSTNKNNRISLKNTFWKSTLFNDIYLDQDIYRIDPEKWDLDGDEGFENCFNSLMNLFSEWDESQVVGWTETETINHWIKPILIALGWVDDQKENLLPYAEETTFSVEDSGKSRTYRADILISDTVDEMSLYANRNLKAEERLVKAKGKVLIPLEAKYWNRINKQYAGKLSKKEEKQKSKEADAANRLGPNGQTLKYMEILGLEWGMLSDGATWRLFNKELSSESEGRYLEFNIYNLYKRASLALENENDSHIFREATKFFYNFFSKKALFPTSKKKELVRNALAESKSYADDVEEDLKDRFVKAMNIVCNGLYRASGKQDDLELIRTVAESHLFNLLFIKSCEARGILPLDANNYWELSLSRMIDALHAFDPDDYEKAPKSMRKIIDEAYHWFQYEEDGYELFDSLINLTQMIHKGSNGSGKGFHIDGFMESVFSKEEWRFAKNCKLTNIEMTRALFEIGFAKGPKGSRRKFQEIPYQYFTPRQLGSIYESFLEYRLEQATESMAYVKRQWRPANLKSDKVAKLKVPKVKKGELFFTPDNKDRKATGSYYTPNEIVTYIIERTIGSLCKGKDSDSILALNICDPAMGSGHFLSNALRFLSDKYLLALDSEILDDLSMTPEEAKRIVLDSCIFGVDMNTRAVKLAKLSLWLESAHPGKKLERLNDQLKTGDSLVDEYKGYSNSFSWQDSFFDAKKFKGFDAVIGNPPWISLKGKFGEAVYSSDMLKHLADKYNANTYMPNTYEFFIHRSLEICKPNGYIGLIVPDRFGSNDQFISLRKQLLNECSFSNIVYKWPFPGVTADTLVFTLKKSIPSSKGKVNFNYYLADVQNIEQERFNQSPSYTIDMPKDQDTLAIIEKIESQKKSDRLQGIASTTSGFGGKSKLMAETQETKKQIKVLRGSSIIKYKVRSHLWFDFCKENITGRTTDKNKLGAKPKILLRKTGDTLMAAFDDSGTFPEQSLYFLYDFVNPEDVYMLLGVLNSSILNFYYNEVAITNKESIAQLKKKDLDLFPFPSNLNSKAKNKISKLAEEAGKKPDLVSAIMAEIDDILFDYYELTEKEKALVIGKELPLQEAA